MKGIERIEESSNTYVVAANILPFVPGAAAVARILNLIVGHKLLSIAHAEAALRFDGRDYMGPVEFYLDPFLAEVARMNRIRWTPSASSNVQIESTRRWLFVGWLVSSFGVCGRRLGRNIYY